MKTKFTLIGLPYAGGSKYSLRFLRNHMLPNIDLVTLDYPGHGSRVKEFCSTDVNRIVDDVFEQIQGLITTPYAIYGHSLGGLIGYLLAHKITDAGLLLPQHLFFSGAVAPSMINKREIISDLSKIKFLEKIQKLGGMPTDILENAELMDFFEPLIRNDFLVVERYCYEKQTPLNIKISVMIGESEDIKDSEISNWQLESAFPVQVHWFKGNHFFILNSAQDISSIIRRNIGKK